jgi:hypothetical protein
MQNKHRGIYSGGNFIFLPCIFFLFLLLFSKELQSQTQSNLEIFYNLADSAAYNAAKNIPKNDTTVKLDLGTGSIYSIFNNRIMESFQKAGKFILSGLKYDSIGANVILRIDKTNINYGEAFQKRLFGDFYAQREISISGNYILFSPVLSPHNFNYTYTDTVNIDDIKKIENLGFPFTGGKSPAEPLLASIYEPVIAIGAAALTVILFFTIRSK